MPNTLPWLIALVLGASTVFAIGRWRQEHGQVQAFRAGIRFLVQREGAAPLLRLARRPCRAKVLGKSVGTAAATVAALGAVGFATTVLLTADPAPAPEDRAVPTPGPEPTSTTSTGTPSATVTVTVTHTRTIPRQVRTADAALLAAVSAAGMTPAPSSGSRPPSAPPDEDGPRSEPAPSSSSSPPPLVNPQLDSGSCPPQTTCVSVAVPVP